MSIHSLAQIQDAVSRRSSSWDRTGGNVDCLTDIAPGETAVLLETEGPGKVTHIWVTVSQYLAHVPDAAMLRDMVLKIYWDGASVPSVDVPLGDFFGLGHGLPSGYYESRKYQVTADPITVGVNERAMNCYFPMPFQKSARIEIYNNGLRSLKQLYFHVDYELGPQPTGSGLFHAEFRQNKELRSQEWVNLSGADNYVLMETEGQGHYVGTMLYIDSDPGGWWGEGDDMIFIDHDTQPTINGTGTEDYFLNAWCYRNAFSYARYGCPLLETRSDGGQFTTVYRFHIDDPIRFSKHIRMTIEHVWDAGTVNSFASVAYWYQDKPIATRAPLPQGVANHARVRPVDWTPAVLQYGLVSAVQLEVDLRTAGYDVKTIANLNGQWLENGALCIATPHDAAQLALPVPSDGEYRVELKPIYSLIDTPLEVTLAGASPVSIPRSEQVRENDGALVNLGRAVSVDAHLPLTVKGAKCAPLQYFRITKLD